MTGGRRRYRRLSNVGTDLPPDIRSFSRAIYWVQAIVFQGQRVLEVHQREYSGIFSDPARLEEQFFLTASEKAVRLVSTLAAQGKDESIRPYLPTDAMRTFTRRMNSTALRNSREHDENYGRLDKPKEELTNATNPKRPGLTLMVDSGVTILRDGDIIIGGQVSVRDTIALAEDLIPNLVESQHRYARSTKPLLETANPDDYPDIFAPERIV